MLPFRREAHSKPNEGEGDRGARGSALRQGTRIWDSAVWTMPGPSLLLAHGSGAAIECQLGSVVQSSAFGTGMVSVGGARDSQVQYTI